MTDKNLSQGVRSPLKWPGGKKRVLHHIRAILPRKGRTRLVEPFVGGGSVFLNLDFDEYLLCDTNSDLISLYKAVKKAPLKFEQDARQYFTEENNTPERYYDLREEFNNTDDSYHRATLFLYLNRHGYNGLCRYNKSGGYNVPFGRYKKPYFPELEIEHLSHKLKKASFIVGDFEQAFDCLEKGDVVYSLYRKYLALNERETNEENNKNSSLMLFTLFYFFTYFIDFVKVEVVYNPIHNIFTRVSTLFFTIFASRQSHEYAGV